MKDMNKLEIKLNGIEMADTEAKAIFGVFTYFSKLTSLKLDIGKNSLITDIGLIGLANSMEELNNLEDIDLCF